MNVEINNFIGVYSDVFPPGFCQHLIDQFNFWESNGAGERRQDPAHRKSDFQLFITNDWLEKFIKTGDNGDLHRIDTRDVLYNGLQRCFRNYTEKFSVLKDIDMHARAIKLQKTRPGEGYHVWHAEQGNGDMSSRCLVWLLYLNTLEPSEAGETEFLYQQKRVRPVENTLILWPASFTHTHRGNTVFGEKDKYIATGWFYINA